MFSVEEVEQQQLMLRKHALELVILKQKYRDSRVDADIQQQRKDTELKYAFSMREAGESFHRRMEGAESRRTEVQDTFRQDLRFRYMQNEMVSQKMKSLFDDIERDYAQSSLILNNKHAQSLRRMEEGIDPDRYVQYEREKHKLEWDEKARVETLNTERLAEKDRECETEATAARRHHSQSTHYCEWACSHKSGY